MVYSDIKLQVSTCTLFSAMGLLFSVKLCHQGSKPHMVSLTEKKKNTVTDLGTWQLFPFIYITIPRMRSVLTLGWKAALSLPLEDRNMNFQWIMCPHSHNTWLYAQHKENQMSWEQKLLKYIQQCKDKYFLFLPFYPYKPKKIHFCTEEKFHTINLKTNKKSLTDI